MGKLKNEGYYHNLYEQYSEIYLQKNIEKDKLQKIIHQFDGFENQVVDLDLLINIYWILYRLYKNLENYNQWEETLTKVLPLLNSKKDFSRLAICYKELSYIERLKGNYDLAFKYIQDSLDNYQKTGDPIRIAGALNSMGNFYLDLGEFHNALEYYYKAYENVKSFHDHESYFIIKYNLANIYLVLNYFSKAKELYVEDLERIYENKLYARYAMGVLGISNIYKEENRTKLAYKYAKLAVDNYAQSNDSVGYATAISNMGSIYSLFGKYEEALDYYEKARTILEKLNYKLELLKLHNMIGETYLQKKEVKEAISHIEKARDMAIEIKQNFELRKIYNNLYKAYDMSNEIPKAYQVLKELTTLNGNLFNLSLQAKVNEVQVNFELEKKELEYNKEREINEYKNNLFSYLTHEFRTPLTLINTPLDLLKNETDIDIIRTRLGSVSSHVLHMQHLLNQLLDINKLEEGKMPVMKKAGNINPLLWHIIHLFEPEMNDKDIQFEYHLPKKKIQGYFDTDKIEKIISNLLSNALKYTHSGGLIEFIVEIEDNNLMIMIRDNGIGIDKEHQEHIFNKFYRIPSSKDVKGSGLGLSFVKELVHLMHGEIKLESTIRKGSKFIVTLPLERIEKLSKPPEKTNGEENEKSKKQSILIVEDNLEIQKLLKEVFQEKYKVHTADNGRDAVLKIKKHIPDIVVSDIMMPLMDGIELCNYIKQDESINHTPVILLTAKTQVNDKLLGLESGADAYITKPFNIEELSKTMENMLLQRKTIMGKFSGNVLGMSEEDLVSADKVFLKEVTDYVIENLENETLSVNDIAKHLNMSRFTLIRKFKQVSNTTPNNFIQKIRLEKAKELIKNKVARVTEIAFKVGFSSTTYFSYSFKKEYGISPKEYFNQCE